MKKTLYRTQILVEFISDEPINSDSDLDALVYEASEGSLSMRTTDKVQNKPIKGMAAVRALDAHGTDYEFFGIDNKGNATDEDEEE